MEVVEEQDYSGFQSRGKEAYYDKAIERLIQLMTERLLSFYKDESLS